ncbi:MAG: hypothetical protein KAI15_08325, partial [Gammaproteobacteria bacterium]|nr:hypothetical protein [Gammaproteobacteria bacterium]
DNPNINNALRAIICYPVGRFEGTILRENGQKSHQQREQTGSGNNIIIILARGTPCLPKI